MNQGKRYLMFWKKDESGIVVEAIYASNWEDLKQETESKRMTCQPLSIENFYPENLSVSTTFYTLGKQTKNIKRVTKVLKNGLFIETQYCFSRIK